LGYSFCGCVVLIEYKYRDIAIDINKNLKKTVVFNKITMSSRNEIIKFIVGPLGLEPRTHGL
jgi:hypothetical protein